VNDAPVKQVIALAGYDMGEGLARLAQGGVSAISE